MNYFDNLSLEKSITVLGASKNSDFVKVLCEFAGADCKVTVPDNTPDGRFKVHSEKEIDTYKAEGMLIGVVDVNVMEKKICDVIDGVEDFCAVNNLFTDELIFPLALARVIENREKYDILYINGVNSEGRRYLARELAKRLRNGMGIRLINTDSNYVETLVRS